MSRIIYLCWKTFIKGNYWIYFGISLLLGFPFIEFLSRVFDLPYKTGYFNFKSVILLEALYFFLLQIAEIFKMIITLKIYYNSWNIFWGLLGFSIALFLMR